MITLAHISQMVEKRTANSATSPLHLGANAVANIGQQEKFAAPHLKRVLLILNDDPRLLKIRML